MARFCSNCGAQLKETSKFCRECGTKTDLPATPVPPSVPSPATPPASVPPAPQVTHPTSQPARNLASLSSNQPAMSATAPVAPAASQPASRHASNTAPRSAGQQSAPRHNSQAEPAKPAKASGCWRGCAVTVLIMLLIAGIGALCIVKGCQPEEPPQPDKPNNPNKPYTNSWPPLPNQKKSPKANSAAITREIQKGVILSVPKGALGRSKKLDVKPVTELNETLQTANRQLLERNIFAVAAWEVDAGLADDERLPGYYTLSVDLGELGIDKSLHSQVRFYRVTDKGDIFEYCTALDGQTASFQSNQNSFVLAAVGIVVIGLPAVFTGAAYVVEYRRETSYYCKTDGENWYIECPTNAKPFQLYWNGKDVDKDFYDNLEKLKKRQNTIINAAKKKYPKTWLEHATSAVSDASSLFSANLGLSKAAQEALDKDPEYQKLKKQIESVPPFIEQTITKIATAYAYLGQVVKVKMPSYTVCFYLKKNLGVLGYQTSTLLRNPYIEINIQQDLKDTAQSGGEKWDNLLLTITHELFHICQEEYHFSYGVNSKKFDEMVTVLLEADALEYYKRTKIITTTPELTSDGPYEYLFQYPMDKDEEGDKAGQYGYALSKFASFVRKQSGKSKITAKNLMEAREYYSRPNISTPLQKCFGISSITLGEYFVSYCQKSFGTFAKAYEGAGYLPLVKLTPAKPVPKSINFSGRFSCMMVRIVLPKKRTALSSSCLRITLRRLPCASSQISTRPS
ncbi:zinc-ribbon domain-containing protein [bacterium]|nr:zinc-ribbon domain-containing protein [bacterium]